MCSFSFFLLQAETKRFMNFVYLFVSGNTGNAIFAISPVWDIEENDVQQLVYLSEEKSNFFRYEARSHRLVFIDRLEFIDVE